MATQGRIPRRRNREHCQRQHNGYVGWTHYLGGTVHPPRHWGVRSSHGPSVAAPGGSFHSTHQALKFEIEPPPNGLEQAFSSNENTGSDAGHNLMGADMELEHMSCPENPREAGNEEAKTDTLADVAFKRLREVPQTQQR